MTTNYNRSQLYDYSELSEEQKQDIKNTYSLEDSDCYSTMYVILKRDKRNDILPLNMFMRADKNNFTHGVYSTSYFDGYFITFNRSNDEAVIAHKYF